MKRFFLCLFLMQSASASDGDFIDYFGRFHKIFSAPQISPQEYSSLITFPVTPDHFIDVDGISPTFYPPESEQSGYVINHPGVIFNGNVSKTFFLRYLQETILQDGSLRVGNKKIYKKKGIEFSFNIDKYEQNSLVLYENILAPVNDGEDNYTDFTCFYSFSRMESGDVTLSDIMCAG